ncbi:MAG: EamA family transporter [Spirosomataceae bacterium]
MNQGLKNKTIGIFFAALWASASAATKFGIRSADPLILANVRFLVAGGLMLLFSHGFFPSKSPLPRGREWRQLLLFSLLNTTLYLSAFVIAMRDVAAGIGSLSTATGPLFVIVLSALWLQRTLKLWEAIGVVLGLSGAALATWPLLQNSYATPQGLLILMAGIVSVSTASVYYAKIEWRLPALVINGWQVLLGGVMLLPFTLYFSDWQHSQLNTTFWLSVFWLIVPCFYCLIAIMVLFTCQDTIKAVTLAISMSYFWVYFFFYSTP